MLQGLCEGGDTIVTHPVVTQIEALKPRVDAERLRKGDGRPITDLVADQAQPQQLRSACLRARIRERSASGVSDVVLAEKELLYPGHAQRRCDMCGHVVGDAIVLKE